ncbi:MAG: hypothetical protein NT123_02100 [Proteobacteria bacterium]|nr:hypothetical protein [Pseudomonadota bacterium]
MASTLAFQMRRLFPPFAAACIAIVFSTDNAAQEVSVEDAMRLAAGIRTTCKPYIENGQRFWQGQFRKVEDAPGSIFLNREIQTRVRKATNWESAGEVGRQICMDFVFNNQRSKEFIK